VRIIIECPESNLHLEADTFTRTVLSPTSSLLQSGGGPYIFTN